MLKITLLVVSVLAAGVAGAVDVRVADSVLVVTDRAHPVMNTGDARVIYLDRAAKIEKEMSAGLPNDIDKAEAILKERLKTPDGERMIAGLTDAAKDLLLAWEMGVSKVPAVIVEGKYVVYGQPDVSAAVYRIAQRRAAQEGVTLPTVKQPLLNKPLRVE
jgi:integrating conjugative element protein (TIGR03757 family)